jgi:heterodisulfide reductase subunit A
VIISPGVERSLDRIDRRFGLAKDTNVITDLQLERMLSESGPSAGLVIRPYDGEIPASVSFVQSYERAAPGMHLAALTFAINEASLLRQKLPGAEIVMFAGGLDDFPEGKKALKLAGVEVLSAPVQSVAPNGGSSVNVAFGADGQAREFDLAVLITQPQLSKDTRDLAKGLGLGVTYADFLSGEGVGLIKTDKQEVQLARQP